jgi:hypothetical protein
MSRLPFSHSLAHGDLASRIHARNAQKADKPEPTRMTKTASKKDIVKFIADERGPIEDGLNQAYAAFFLSVRADGASALLSSRSRRSRRSRDASSL